MNDGYAIILFVYGIDFIYNKDIGGFCYEI